MDVKQVEIFRGAQSTLQGRNAIAGTLIYTTNDPTFVPEYAGRIAASSYNGREIAALASGPIIDGELAYRLALDHQSHDSDVKGFLGYPGVDDPGAFESNEPYVNYTYKPEYVWNLEGFARSRLLDGRLRLTGNIFYSRYKDMQLPFDLNPDPAVWAYVVRNAPRAETYGAELGATWLPQPSLELSAEVGLLHARVTRYDGSGVAGHELPRAPRLTSVLGANWRAANGLEVGASAHYSTAYYSDITNVTRGRVEPGWLANTRISYPIGKAKLFAYVNNVFDSKRPVLVSADPGDAIGASDVANLPQARTIGVSIEAWF